MDIKISVIIQGMLVNTIMVSDSTTLLGPGGESGSLDILGQFRKCVFPSNSRTQLRQWHIKLEEAIKIIENALRKDFPELVGRQGGARGKQGWLSAWPEAAKQISDWLTELLPLKPTAAQFFCCELAGLFRLAFQAAELDESDDDDDEDDAANSMMNILLEEGACLKRARVGAS